MTPGSPGFHSPTGSKSFRVTAACRSRRLLPKPSINRRHFPAQILSGLQPLAGHADCTLNHKPSTIWSSFSFHMPGNRHRRGTTNRPMSVQKHPAQRCVLCSRLPVTRATVANLGVLPPLEVCGVTCDRSSVELWPTRYLKHLLFQAFPHHP